MLNPNDISKNRLLLLSLLAEVSKRGRVYGIIKEQKVAHALQLALRDKGRRGLSYTFEKDDMGPRSTGVYRDIDVLVSAGFWSDEIHKPTEAGEELLREYEHILLSEDNREIWETVTDIASEYASLTPPECKALAYQFHVSLPGSRQIPMSEVKKGTIVLGPYGKGRTFYVPKAELNTLRFEFDQDAKAELQMAIERCRIEDSSSKDWREVVT